MQTPRTEFAQALHAIAQERGLDPNVILDTIKQAIIAAYKRDAREQGIDTDTQDYDVLLDSGNGEAKVFSWPMPSLTNEDGTELTSEEFQAKNEEAKKDKKDVTPPGFGRIAAQTAKQVIHQKIREAEKGAVMDEFTGRIGMVMTGMILRFEGPDVRVDLGKTEGLMPKEERVPNERLNPNQRMSFLLKDIRETMKGKQIILSRADALFVHKLFEREVPEISSHSVEVKAIAREAGVRTKMAVFSNQSGVDPVGSCVGQKGVRVQAVTNELGGERVDIIPWTEDMATLIASSLAPADGLIVTLSQKDKTATVKAPVDQLSLAIGKDGQNARLAAKLTGWKIEIKELPGEAKTETTSTEKAEVKAEESAATSSTPSDTTQVKPKKSKKDKVEKESKETVIDKKEIEDSPKDLMEKPEITEEKEPVQEEASEKVDTKSTEELDVKS